MLMRKLRNILTLVVIGMMAVILICYFNYEDLSWTANKSNYIGLLTVVCVIITNIGSNRVEKKRAAKQ